MITRILLTSLAVCVLAMVVATNYHRFKTIEWRPESEVGTFEARIGHGCESVHKALGERLGGTFRGMQARPAIEMTSLEEDSWADPLRRRAKNAREFAGEGSHEEPYESEQYRVAPELEGYFDLPPQQRTRDWMLLHNDESWESEYYYRGAPAPFRGNFIVHLICEGGDSTTVRVYEEGAQVCAGEWFGLHATHGHLFPNYSFGFHPDCRLVAPTRVDRVELLRHIQALF